MASADADADTNQPAPTLLLRDKAFVGKKPVRLTLTSTELYWMPQSRQGHAAGFVDLWTVLTAGVSQSKATAVDLLVVSRSSKDATPKVKTMPFVFATDERAEHWANAIVCTLAGVAIGETVVPRRLLVLVNPFSGKKKGQVVFRKQVKPLLDACSRRVVYTVVETERSGHAGSLVSETDLSTTDAIVTVSGDGLFHEVVNGLMSRQDWVTAIKIPLGIIPAGSGNGLAASVHTSQVLDSVLCVVHGHSRPLDLMSIRQPGQNIRYSHLSFTHGLIADIDIESERYRWAGAARFTFSGVGRIMNLRKYPGRLSFIPWNENEDLEEAHARPDGQAPELLYWQQNEGNWKVVESDFVMVTAMNLGWLSDDGFFGPFYDFADGAIDLMFTLGDRATSSKLLAGMSDQTTGNHIKTDWVSYLKVKAFRFETEGNRGIFNADGEVLPSLEVQVENHKGLARLLCPSWLELPTMPLAELPAGGINIPDLQTTASQPGSESPTQPKAADDAPPATSPPDALTTPQGAELKDNASPRTSEL
eukprot:m.148133 g.148133  ORF g.148133 m.148133 type:complete len:533 (+) comp17306_c0_seq5:77-1675(+)